MFYKLKYILNCILECEEEWCSIKDKKKDIDFAKRYVDGAIRYDDEIIHYETIRKRQFKKVYNRFVKVSGWKSGHNILDYGCGKGYMLYLLNRYGNFASITGLEILPELCSIARLNIIKLDVKADIIEADAREYDKIDQIDIFFLFNPFPEDAMKKVVKRISCSLERNMRKIYLIYINDVCNDIIIEKIPGIRIVEKISNMPRFGCYCSIYTN